MPGFERAPLDTAILARSFAWAFGFCATLVLISLVLPTAEPGSMQGMLVSALLAYELMLVLLIGHDRLPAWVFPLLPFLGTAVVTAVLFWSAPATVPAYALLYFVVVLAAFYSFSRRIAIAQLVAVAGAYAVAARVRGLGDTAIVYWVMTTGALVVAALLLILLRGRIDGVIAMLRQQATTDSLTGLLNRRGVNARLREEVERARRGKRTLAVAIADLDGLKQMNDRLGHAAGDAALVSFAEAVGRSKRLVDVAGRVGGDEFAILLPDTDTAGAVRALDRLRTVAGDSFVADDLRLRASFGVGMFTESACTPDQLLAVADAALYRAKAGGGDRIVVSDQID